jgi:hypothetical protein
MNFKAQIYVALLIPQVELSLQQYKISLAFYSLPVTICTTNIKIQQLYAVPTLY